MQPLSNDATPTGDPEVVTTGLGIQSVDLLQDGTKIAYSKGGRFGNLWRVPILPDRVATWPDSEQLTFDQALIEFVDVSPDGRRLIVNSSRSGFYDLWLLPAEGGELQPLTSDTPADDDSSWSPDGKEIAFYTRRTGNRDVFVMPSEGGPMRQLTTYAGADANPVWSPDGKVIAYMSVRDGNRDIWLTTPKGDEHIRLTEHPAVDRHPAFSPDGRWIAFDSFRADDGPHIWRIGADGSDPERLTTRRGRMPVWAPDGEKIYFLTPDRNEIWAVTLAGRTERAVADLSGSPGTRGPYALATGGNHLYFTWEETLGDIWIMDIAAEQ
jgi:TolB protein